MASASLNRVTLLLAQPGKRRRRYVFSVEEPKDGG